MHVWQVSLAGTSQSQSLAKVDIFSNVMSTRCLADGQIVLPVYEVRMTSKCLHVNVLISNVAKMSSDTYARPRGGNIELTLKKSRRLQIIIVSNMSYFVRQGRAHTVNSLAQSHT